MSTQSYEIELVRSETDSDYHISMLATVTGLPKQEIWEKLPEHLKKANSWRGSSFGEVARLLGYNTNLRFIKFDPETPWPCILRVQVPDEWGWKGKWWALVYNQKVVYDVHNRPALRYIEHWLDEHPGCRITSMLQVWISDL
jgi:hypothetical protein